MEEHQKKWTVYKHTAPNGKVYIGITSKQPVRRWGVCGQGYKNNKHFWSAIRKYGWENIQHEIIASALSREVACKIEVELIDKYKSYSPEYGYNIALGGQGNLMTDEQKSQVSKKMKAAWGREGYKEFKSLLSKQMWADKEFRINHSGENHPMYGKHHTKETREKIAKTRKERNIPPPTLGKHLSEETKAKISKAHKGKTFSMSDEAKEHIRQAKLGDKNPNYNKPMDEELKKRLIEMHSLPVIKICDGVETLYKSIKEASIETGVVSGNISRVCKGQRATAGGFVWRYASP